MTTFCLENHTSQWEENTLFLRFCQEQFCKLGKKSAQELWVVSQWM